MAALEGDIPDRVPVSIVSSAWVYNHYHLELCSVYENADAMTKAWKSFDSDFAADSVVPGLSSTIIPSYYGTTWKFPSRGFPLLQEPAVKEPSDLDKLESLDPAKDKFIQASIDHTKQLVEEFSGKKCVWFMTTGPLSNAARIVKTQFLMECLIEDPLFVKQLFKFSTDAFIAAIEPILELGVDILDFSSSPGSPDLISPRMYREFFWKFDKELVNWIHSMGVKAVFHICGNTLKIIEDMANTGADGLSVDSMLDLSEARKIIGKTTIVGNIDPANILMNGTPEDVEHACMQAIREGGLTGSFVLAPGCDVAPTTPADNVATMINTAKKYGTYPLKF